MGVTSIPSNFVTISAEMFKNVASVKKPPSNLNFVQLSQFIYQTEGVAGFFRGGLPMIAGKALIKAVSFSSNNFALFLLQTFPPVSESVLVQQYLPPSSPLQLVVAACFAGFMSSFTVNPIERIKVLMQASSHAMGNNKMFALQLIMEVLKVEGWKGLLGRGLGTTIAREVPAVTINFFIYELLSDTYIAKDVLGPFLSPMIFGALSGMACWITVYPIDTVKTILQNSNGQEQINILLIITSIYRKGGIPAFFHGLTPILLRASLNHAATFSIHAMLMHALSPGL
jgi:solute carrier family 25 carnitine/acylcarnitine transporter 20/29